MCGYSGWAGIFVALQRLDTTERKHEAARTRDKVSPVCKCPCNFSGGNQFARCDYTNAFAQPLDRQ